MIQESLLSELAGQLKGRVVTPDSADYDSARRIYNASYLRRPDAIAMCTSAADVQSAVRIAQSAKLPTTIRTTGHQISGFASIDNGLIIDLSSMEGVTVDLERQLADVLPGTRNSNLDRATFPHGFMCPTGTCEDVAITSL
jgi:FAD/FMN-containing dehydrogenase